MSWDTTIVRFDGVEIPVPCLTQAASRRSIVIAHGLEDTWTSWQPIAEELAPHYDVYVPRLPWEAGSDHIWMDLGRTERWLSAVLDAIPGRLALVSHSISSVATLRLLAGRHGNHTDGAVLVAPLFVPTQQWNHYVVADQCASDLAASKQQFMLQRLAGRVELLGADVVESMAVKLLEGTDWPLMRKLLVENADTTGLDLAAVQTPVGVVAPSQDPMHDRGWFRALEAAVPKAEQIQLSDCGHLCHIEKPLLVAAAISNFFSRTSVDVKDFHVSAD